MILGLHQLTLMIHGTKSQVPDPPWLKLVIYLYLSDNPPPLALIGLPRDDSEAWEIVSLDKKSPPSLSSIATALPLARITLHKPTQPNQSPNPLTLGPFRWCVGFTLPHNIANPTFPVARSERIARPRVRLAGIQPRWPRPSRSRYSRYHPRSARLPRPQPAPASPKESRAPPMVEQHH